MTDVIPTQLDRLAVADPTTVVYWSGAREGRLVIQQCLQCARHQFYPRPFCLACGSRRLGWSEAGGQGRIYSMTTIRIPVADGPTPPYVLALVELAEGPRLLTHLVGEGCAIGDRVEIAWGTRGGLPVPLFTKCHDQTDVPSGTTDDAPTPDRASDEIER